jgi:hypothetical protein
VQVSAKWYLAGMLVRISVLYFQLLPNLTTGQSNFNISLLTDFTAAERIIELCEGQPTDTRGIARLRGNRIAAATTGLIAERRATSSLLENYLDSLKHRQIIRDDVFHLESARRNVAAMRELLVEMQRRNFGRRVVATVEQIFPSDTRLSVEIPMYIVALGHENVDAYVRRIVWQGDSPVFVGEEDLSGEFTIIVNCARAVDYGDELQDRFVSLLGVVAHEVFHAAFGAYKKSSSRWQEYNDRDHPPIEMLLDLTHNEGIAYYLSLDQRGGGYLPRDWNRTTREALVKFNRSAEELLSPGISPGRVAHLLRTANLSGYESSYGSLTGMFIAREIDLRLGRASLISTIASGSPYDFFRKYASLSRQESNLPQLSDSVKTALER